MNRHTPSINVVDPRGLAVRALAYHRLAAVKPITARVTQQVFDPLGRLVQQRDPRLFALRQSDASVPANLTTIHNLTGQALCSDSVDAGWQLGLAGAAGQVLESWDQRGWHRRTEHDPLLRPVAVHEQVSGEPERCVERMTFGGVSDDHARYNCCGQPIRQDDPAGSRLMTDYGLSAVVLHERRHFLNSFAPVDWPALYTDRDRLLEPGTGAQTSWRFASTGEVAAQTDAKGHTQYFAHDRAGQLRSVGLKRSGQQGVDTLVSAIHYSASGQVEHELAGNGMRTTSVYNPSDGHLMLLATQCPDQSFLQKLSYCYDPVGNITEITDAALPIQHFANQRIEPVRRFRYDTLYQLISATGWETVRPSFGPALPEWQTYGPPDGSRWCNYSETYDYDEAGNLLQRIHHGAVGDTLSMRVAPLSNRSVKVHPTQTGVDESFDARGNLLELQPGQGLQWNGRSQLAQVTPVVRVNGADDLERYVYDSEGTRLRKTRTTAAKSIAHTAEVRYLPGLELHSNSATGEQLQVVSIQAGRCTVRLLHWDSPPPAEMDNDQLRFCFDDHLGSSAFEVDAQAKVISQEVYYPFGGTAWLAGRHEVEIGYKTIRYSGKERDATGLYYYGARYYAPWLQRWLNPDPAGDVDGLNFYRFVKSGPVSYFDDLGSCSAFAALNDFVIETYDGIGGLVVARGFEEVRLREPEMAKGLDSAFSRAKNILMNATAEIQHPLFEKNIIEGYVGEVSLQDVLMLKNNMIKMEGFMKRYGPGSRKVVLLDGDNWTGYNAKVFRYDRRSKVYLSDDVRRNTVEANAMLLIHEVSHLALDTKDYWYRMSFAEKKGFGDDVDQYGLTPNDEYERSEFLYQSKRMMRGHVKADDVEPEFMGGLKTKKIDKSIVRFKASPEVRTRMALKNADTFASISSALSRVHSKRRMDER
ncbi:RHS repeat-associated core domain-containing protein [Pseudomonas sp. P5_109]|uniref:RHS repeat domain-containing protein n=1 Tax=Pseudomonas sp. P5_109 TaxID=3043441 RepID=UPI002A359EF3|nr:RHS repeat-associated core domain-containing protein [Pseudomonas sp. P5_109]WPN32932.1 RHS repeat-associated core domain-containing protein [Pseudomonas sp. P5_109]